ncbi:uncharacterized protein LOC112189735 [Rosa chinensis]|uniref:uncharacterized protein LOC112189735 n=1 Tax=Rosa chinensis TaxID=74649 RepID=UPI001AD910F4|nr:uncharacterized protein LOC112189735 [Rosa chinensis]
MSTVLGSSSDLSQEGVVDLEDKKNDDHSTRKRPYNTESKPVGDLCGNKGDSPRKGPLVMSDSESAELACEFANNSTSGQKGNPIVRALPQNTPLSDFLKAEAEAEAEAEAGVVDLEDKKNDDLSTRKRPYNTESKPVGDLCGNKGDSPRKRPLVMSDSESAELVCRAGPENSETQCENLTEVLCSLHNDSFFFFEEHCIMT